MASKSSENIQIGKNTERKQQISGNMPVKKSWIMKNVGKRLFLPFVLTEMSEVVISFGGHVLNSLKLKAFKVTNAYFGKPKSRRVSKD